jgi:hypothetical protein
MLKRSLMKTVVPGKREARRPGTHTLRPIFAARCP